ncbi:dnaJ homolog subfamily C member 16 [Rhagoletis pomonella]|uniref:dnaJ homolog subfamily C member 16 n=1 Tax=Rhagoletis pomonella TaxID=28610 RepID=UPI00177AC594|nr:dnaJ homolog subfamily C member 16 [Rhagoletis pomonella]
MSSKATFGSWICIGVLVFITLLRISEGGSPYEILGIETDATSEEVRRAYKRLVKTWHPDKSEHPEASTVFVKIKQAYELLSDADRRRIYDQHGILNEDSYYFPPKSDLNKGRSSSDQFENFFGNQFSGDNDISFYHKISISGKNYDKKVVSKSKTIPHLVIFYNDWCFRCTRLISSFKKLINALEPLGIYFAAVNAAYEPLLVKKSGVSDIPSVILVLDGHSYVYRENIYTLAKIKEFVRKKMPHSITQRIDDNNVDEFLGGWMDNRVRALVFEPRNRTRLRYLLSAYAFHHRVAFGLVHLNSSTSLQIQIRYEVSTILDTLLVFNEDFHRPLATISLPEIPVKTLNQIISSNQYLMLPRLSSQQVMEGVCPAEWSRPRKRLCVILITENNDSYNHARINFRNIALQTEYSKERVRFAYMFKNKQIDFINAISKGAETNQVYQIVIIWRCDQTHLKYEWIKVAQLNMESNLYDSNEYVINVTKRHLDKTIQRLLKAGEAFRFEAFVENLFDEHSQTFINKWLAKFGYLCEYLIDHLEKEHILAMLSLIGTVVFMFAVGYIMVYFVRAEEESLKERGQLKGHPNFLMKQTRSTPELKLHELRAEKYNGMVRLLKPGCRTIILVTDIKTRPKLIPSFHKAVWPYRKSKTLLFGHMLIEKGLLWYAELLRLSLCESKPLNINPRNCVGTVIALNGHRKYFCMYHAKHPESVRDEKLE